MKTALGTLLAFLLLTLPGCGAATSDDVDAYVEHQAKPLDLEQPLESASLGNTDGYQVFLVGETHTKAKSKQAEKMFVCHFYENEGVRYFLWETGLGAGLLLDHYLQTGNADDLDFYMTQLDGTAAYTQNEYDFWTWMQTYNATLPEDQKLHVIGLDIDHQPATAARGLSLLVDSSTASTSTLAPALDKAQNGDVQALEELGLAVKDRPDDAKALFGNLYEWAEQFFDNFDHTVQYYSGTDEERSSKSNDLRDEAMMSNFQFVQAQHPHNVFMGVFGSEHIFQSACETEFCSSEYNRFGMRLNTNVSPVKGAVCSILFAYTEQGIPFFRSYSPSNGDINYQPFEKWFGEDAYFSLDEPESPFSTEECLINQADNVPTATTDYFQKLLLLSDSQDCTPYRQPASA